MSHPKHGPKIIKIMGISLIEILIALLIISVLAGLSYPSYREYITKARRADGISALLDLANRMERYYATTLTYATATLATGNRQTDVRDSEKSALEWYRLNITAQTATTYTLQAIPIKSQSIDDTKCQSLTINHLGSKGISPGPGGAPTGNVTMCW